MERRLAMGLAAVAALGLLLYLRKGNASAETAGTGGVLTSNAALLNSMLGNAAAGWGANPVTITVNKQPAAVSDAAASGSAPRAVFGGTVAGAAEPAAGNLDAKGVYHYADGSSAYTGGGTFGHVTDDQRKGKTDAQLALGILGY